MVINYMTKFLTIYHDCTNLCSIYTLTFLTLVLKLIFHRFSSFIKRGFQSVDTCTDKTLINNGGNCHVYSLPYLCHDFLFMTSCFEGDKFDKVRILMMLDRGPFEHKLSLKTFLFFKN